MGGIDILLEYFILFKEKEKDEHFLKGINNIITILENTKNRTNKVKYITDYNFVEKIIERYDLNELSSLLVDKIKNNYSINEDDIKSSDIPSYLKDILSNLNKGIDNIKYDIMYNVSLYDAYLMNKKVKTHGLPIDADISFDNINVGLKEILDYLEVDEKELDKDLIKDINRFGNLDVLKGKAISVKTDINLKSVLYDKVNDKNLLLSILLHTNLDTVKNIVDVFESRNANINKVIGSISSIYIKDLINSKCKFNVLCNYDNFINNISLLDEMNIELKQMTNHPVFLLNSFDKNRLLINNLNNLGINVKNILEYVGDILVLKPEVVFNNIKILDLYGVKLTDDNNNNGYTLLGMEDLSLRLDYLIEQGIWKKSDGQNYDNIDLIRGLIIKDDYLKWKNNYKYVKLDVTSLEEEFTNNIFEIEELNSLYEKKPELKNIIDEIDAKYLVQEDNSYAVGVNVVSRLRVLRNLCNYKGKGDAKEIFNKSLLHKSNFNNSEEIVRAMVPNIEMGDESVKLSKGL